MVAQGHRVQRGRLASLEDQVHRAILEHLASPEDLEAAVLQASLEDLDALEQQVM